MTTTMKRIWSMMLTVAVLTLLVACQKKAGVQGDFWVKGLSLPAGSVVASEREEERDIKDDPGNPYQRMRTKTVMFNSPDSWDKVVQHFDGQLGGMGFKETQYSSIASDPNASAADKNLMKGSRFYVNGSGDLAISLSTISPDISGSDRMAPQGQIMMMVMQFE